MKYSFFSETSGPVVPFITAVSGSVADSAPWSSCVTYSPFWRAMKRLLAKHMNKQMTRRAARKPPIIALVDELENPGMITPGGSVGGGRVSNTSAKIKCH